MQVLLQMQWGPESMAYAGLSFRKINVAKSRGWRGFTPSSSGRQTLAGFGSIQPGAS